MPAIVNDIAYSTVRKKIDLLIDNLVNITDETGEFLLKLEDGRVIDTKGWGDWEWTHGIGLYGLLKYWDMTGESKAQAIIEDWFADRFSEGTPTKNGGIYRSGTFKERGTFKEYKIKLNTN